MSKTVQPALVVQGGPAVPPKHIKVNGHKIHFRFLQSVLWGVFVTSLAVAAVAALYYLITQQSYFGHSLKASWDGLFTQNWWSNYRHGLRDFGEPVLAAMAVHSLIVGSWKKHVGERLTGLILVVRVVIALAAAFAVIILGVYLINYGLPYAWHHLFHHGHVTASVSNSALGNVFSGINWQAFVFSFIVVHLIHILWVPVGNTISLVFTESAVRRAAGTLPVWVRHPLAPPAMRERFVWTQETTSLSQLESGPDIATRVVMLLALLLIPLAGYGEYILHVIAKGH